MFNFGLKSDLRQTAHHPITRFASLIKDGNLTDIQFSDAHQFGFLFINEMYKFARVSEMIRFIYVPQNVLY